MAEQARLNTVPSSCGSFSSLRHLRAVLGLLLTQRSQFSKLKAIEQSYEDLSLAPETLEPIAMELLDGLYDPFLGALEAEPSLQWRRLGLACQLLMLYRGLTWEDLAQALGYGVRACVSRFNRLFYAAAVQKVWHSEQLGQFLDVTTCSLTLRQRMLEIYQSELARHKAETKRKSGASRRADKSRIEQASSLEHPTDSFLPVTPQVLPADTLDPAPPAKPVALADLGLGAAIRHSDYLVRVRHLIGLLQADVGTGRPIDLFRFERPICSLYKHLLGYDNTRAVAAELHAWLKYLRTLPGVENLVRTVTLTEVHPYFNSSRSDHDIAWRLVMADLLAGSKPNPALLRHKPVAASLLALLYPFSNRGVSDCEPIKRKFPEIFLTLWQWVPQQDQSRPWRVVQNLLLLIQLDAGPQELEHLLTSPRQLKACLFETLNAPYDWRHVFASYDAGAYSLQRLIKTYPGLIQLFEDWQAEHCPELTFASLIGQALAREAEYEQFFERFQAAYSPETWVQNLLFASKRFCGKSLPEIAALLGLDELPQGYRGLIKVGLGFWPRDPYLNKLDAALASPEAAREACRQLLKAYARAHRHQAFKTRNDVLTFRFWGLSPVQFASALDIPMDPEAHQHRTGRAGYEQCLDEIREYAESEDA